MLMLLGPVRFEVAPMNAHDIMHSHASDYVAKPVMGASEPLEWMGEGAETWVIRGRLFPHRFGGLGDLRLLYEARRSGLPQYMMRGDGAQMGWVVIESVTERSSHLDGGGVGRMIEFDVTVRRASAPVAGLYFSILRAVLQ